MSIKVTLVLLITIAIQIISSGQESLPEQFRGKPSRPVWWSILRRCDLCVVASSVKLDEAHKERLLDSDNKVVAEYFPVEMRIDRILFLSPKMAFDGRFLKGSDSQYRVKPKYNPLIKVFHTRVFSGNAGIVDSYFIGDHPRLPHTAIFTLVKSNHKKGEEFLITSYSGIENVEEYIKAIAGDLPEMKRQDAQQAAPSDGDKPVN